MRLITSPYCILMLGCKYEIQTKVITYPIVKVTVMRQANRHRLFKLQHKSAHIRRNFYFRCEQQDTSEPLAKIEEFEKLKSVLLAHTKAPLKAS